MYLENYQGLSEPGQLVLANSFVSKIQTLLPTNIDEFTVTNNHQLDVFSV